VIDSEKLQSTLLMLKLGRIMLQAVTFDFWGTLYQNAYARDERLHLLEDVLARHSQPRPWTAIEAAYRHAAGDCQIHLIGL